MKEAVIEEYVQSDSINSYQSSELTYYEIPEEVTQPVIPNVFGDNMLIQRDKSFRVWGLAPSGAKVEVYLKTQDTKKAVLASGVLAAEDNSFVVEMPAMSGSVKNYDLIINFPDNEFSKTVKNVVFGDLFLASGQSNMQVSVYDDYDEAEIMEKANNPNIRYYNPPIMPVGGTDLDTEYPYHPQLSPQNYTLTWGVGTDSSFMGLKSVSSVAVNAAIKMYELLNKEKEEVPVGLMNLPVGGTTILSWLPMSASLDEDFKTLMGDRGIYSEEDYNNPQNNPGGFWNQYGALFNSKIAPVRYMNICGTLWYQGESDAAYPPLYREALEKLIELWSEQFGYPDASMPFVMSQLAPFNTGLVNDTNAIGFTVFNEIYTENANSRSESRAVVSIYDVPLDYARNDKAPIHPKKKTLIGERMGMALCCLNGYVDNNYLAPQVEKLETDGNRIILTFSNAGGGLRSLYGLPLRGFTVAGADNKYYEAYAEVTGVNRVTLYSPSVSAPINATYAFSDLCMKSNLCNELGIAAVPYRSTKENFTAYYAQHDYTSCDFLQVFRYFSVYEAGYVDMYNGKSSSIALNENGKTGNCLEITPEKTDFGFEIILSYAYDVAQFNQYETFSIYLKKSGNEDVAVSDIRIYADRIYYILEPEFQDAVLKDDFVKYTFRLDSTSYRGEEFKHNTLPITGLTKISINFTSEKSDVVVYADNIYFG